jgi:hypothetical protein
MAHDIGEPKPDDAADNLDAPLPSNDTVEGTVGGVALHRSACAAAGTVRQ